MPTLPPTHKPPWYDPEAKARRDEERRKRIDAQRPTAHQRGYDADWREVRAQFLRAFPDCCVEGCREPATEVDHVQSVRARPDLRLVWANLRPLCKPHHSRRTAVEQGFARSRRR